MTNEKRDYLKRQAQKAGARFIKCEGIIYEVTAHRFPTGPSPRWSVDEVVPVDIPDHAEDAVSDCTPQWPIIEHDSIFD